MLKDDRIDTLIKNIRKLKENTTTVFFERIIFRPHDICNKSKLIK